MSEQQATYYRKSVELGKLPPQHIDAEEALLGTYLQWAPARKEFMNAITPQMFYKEQNKFYYEVMSRLHGQGKPVDLITVRVEASKSPDFENFGGLQTIVQLMGKEIGTDRVSHYIALVRNAWMLREVIRIAYNAQQTAHDPTSDPTELLASIHEELFALVGQNVENTIHVQKVIEDVFTIIVNNRNNVNQFTGLGTGFTPLDRHTGGLQPGDLVVVAGETSNGKTAFAVNLAVNTAELGNGVGIFSLEMTNRQNVSRMLATRSAVSAKGILMYKLSDPELEKITNSAGQIMQLPIWFDDTSSYQIDRLLEAIRAMVIRHGVRLVVIDYLQLVKGSVKLAKQDQVAEIANELKRLAKSLNIPIVLLSQLSRGDNPKPTLSRLKGSGDIENAADLVIFVMRPEIYGMTDFSIQGISYQTANLVYIDVAKGRNYGLTEFPLSFNPDTALLQDLIEFPTGSNDYGFEIDPTFQLNY